MSENYTGFYNKIDQTEIGKNQFHKIAIRKVNDFEIKNALEIGHNITGYMHDTTPNFITHAIDSHGDSVYENGRKNIAITKDDIKQIPNIIDNFDYVVFGVKRKGEDRIIYIKRKGKASYIFIEEFLDGKKNKRLRSKSLFIRNEEISSEKLLMILESNKKHDITGAKAVAGSGGHPTGRTHPMVNPTAATSAQPSDTSLSSISPEKSSDRRFYFQI